MRWLLRSKIHRATVTEANPDYTGSITIDQDLVEKAGLLAGEKVLVASLASGVRLETYVILGPRDSGEICMNGAAALQIRCGEKIIIMGFELADQPIERRSILVNENNKFVKFL